MPRFYSPEDLLLHLCLHAVARMVFEPGLNSFVTLARSLQHNGGDMDWGLVQRCTREWGIGKCVYLTFFF